MPPDELCEYIIEAQRLTAQHEKQAVYHMVISLASMFKQGILEEYIGKLDEITGEKEDQQYTVKKSMKELNKLTSLFGGK